MKNTTSVPRENTVCFTGRRPKNLIGYRNRNAYQKFVNELVEVIKDLRRKGYIRFITGGAQGFDQLAFWAVNIAKNKFPDIQNSLFLPFPGQEKRWNDDGLFSQTEYAQMRHNADTEQFVQYNAPKTKKEAASALMGRNHAMVKASSLLVALYTDDDWSEYVAGGTAECMRYANNNGLKILQLKYAAAPGALTITQKLTL